MQKVGVVVGYFSGAGSLPALLILVGCCTTREVVQSGIVPFAEPLPPPSSHGSGDIYAGGSGLIYLEPSGSGTELGHYVAAGQLQVAGSLRPIAGFQLRPVGMVAIAEGASPVGPGLIERPSAPTFGAGVDLGYTFGDEDDWYLVRPHMGGMVSGIAMGWQDPAGGNSVFGTGWTGIVEGGIDLGWWATGELLIIGSLDARNAPVVPRSVIAGCESPPFTRFGELSMSARIGVEVEPVRGFGLFAGLSFPVFGSPYVAYPSLAIGVRTTFGDARQGFRRSRIEPADAPDLEAETDHQPREDTLDAVMPPAPNGAVWTLESIPG